MIVTPKNSVRLNITCRVLIALVGGYVLAMLSAILIALLLHGDKINSIITGLMLSFIIYTATALSVFATKTPHRACFYVLTLCCVMYGFICYFDGALMS